MADVPVAPAIVGLILGPLFEQQLSRSMAISGGDVGALFESPLSIALWLVAAIALVAPYLWQRFHPAPG
jgi:putative tricarboxylic transport membrane protein